MHDINRYVSLARDFIKDALHKCKHNMETDIPISANMVEYKGLEIESVDTFIKAYRLIERKHKIMSEYYGINIFMSMSCKIYGGILFTYGYWYATINGNSLQISFTILTLIILSMVPALMVSMIGDSVTEKVRLSVM